MKELISPLIKMIPKPVLFMLVSAVGCFLFALLVEPLLYLTQRPSASKQSPQSICLTMDVSGSMQGEPLGEVKRAAKSFVQKRDLSRDEIAIVAFSDYAEIIQPFSQKQETLFERIDRLYSMGGTNFEDAMSKSETVVGREHLNDGKERPAGLKDQDDLAILLFTDGESTVGNPYSAISTASRLREKGVRIFAIAAGDANFAYLTELTGSRDHVIRANSGNFEAAFAQAEQLISTKTLAGTHRGGFQSALIFIMVLTVFLSCGITFFLAGTQNKLVKKPWFTTKQFIFLLFAAILAGTISGFIAEIFNTALRFINLGAVGSLIGWTVLGGILAFGMVFFIPNLKRDIALKGGALGGFLGAIGFLILSSIFGDMGGRLLGAFILGGCIGAMVGIVEVVSRKVWLAVVYSPRDVTVVNLGPQTVTVGSGNDDTVLVRDVDKRAAEFRVDGNIVRYKGEDGNRSLEPGARVKLGDVELVVCSQEVPFSPSRFYPLIFSRAMELKSQGKIPQ